MCVLYFNLRTQILTFFTRCFCIVVDGPKEGEGGMAQCPPVCATELLLTACTASSFQVMNTWISFQMPKSSTILDSWGHLTF